MQHDHNDWPQQRTWLNRSAHTLGTLIIVGGLYFAAGVAILWLLVLVANWLVPELAPNRLSVP